MSRKKIPGPITTSTCQVMDLTGQLLLQKSKTWTIKKSVVSIIKRMVTPCAMGVIDKVEAMEVVISGIVAHEELSH